MSDQRVLKAFTPPERRVMQSTELRATVAGQKRTIAGYAARYGVTATIKTPKGPFRERIARGAFRSVLQSRADVACLYNHDAGVILGRTSADTLQLGEDDDGLMFSCDLPDTEIARSIHQSVQRGDIRGMSFSFGDVDDQWDEEDTQDEEDLKARGVKRSRLPRRTINNFRQVHEVSAVAFPAYQGTSVSARSGVENRSEIVIPFDADIDEYLGSEDRRIATVIALRRQMFLESLR